MTKWADVYPGDSEKNATTQPPPTAAQLSAIRLAALRERLEELELWEKVYSALIETYRKVDDDYLIEQRIIELKNQIDEIAYSELSRLIPKKEI